MTIARNLASSQRGLRDIDMVAPRSEADQACFDELRAVLQKHGAESRFGVALLHRHFDVYEDEVLVETCDSNNRTLTLKPVRVTDLGNLALKETNWRLDLDEKMTDCTGACVSYCPYSDGRHTGSIHDHEHK